MFDIEFNELGNRGIPDGAKAVRTKDHIFFISTEFPPKFYDPFVLGAMIVGTVLQVQGTLQQGRDAQKIAEARAQIERDKADAIDEAADEEAVRGGEKRQRAIAAIRSQIATGNVRLGGDLDLLLITAENAERTKQIGFKLKRSRELSAEARFAADLEIATGKALKKQSKFKALSQGILGFGSIAFMKAKVPGAPPGGTSLSPATANRIRFPGTANFLI